MAESTSNARQSQKWRCLFLFSSKEERAECVKSSLPCFRHSHLHLSRVLPHSSLDITAPSLLEMCGVIGGQTDRERMKEGRKGEDEDGKVVARPSLRPSVER